MIKLDPWEILIRDIFDGREFCTYGHYCDDTLFYVGSGVLPRAFDFSFGKRNEEWHCVRADRPVTVRIFGRHRTADAARRMEYDIIRRNAPVANETRAARGRSKGMARMLETTRPWEPGDTLYSPPLRSGQCVIIICEPVEGGPAREYRSIKEVMHATGISQGAISNTLSGRYPSVRGLKMRREIRDA